MQNDDDNRTGPRTSNDNMIDILKKGHQEMFHASMIAWLLDPNAGHGLGDAFVKGFASRLSARGCRALDGAAASDIRTESVRNGSRYDIEMQIGGVRLVIENKTKSAGCLMQMKKYSAEGCTVAGLGLSEISFAKEAREAHPVLTYGDVLEILDKIDIPADSDMSVLIRHYRDYLRRELGMLRLIDETYTRPLGEDHGRLAELVEGIPNMTENDRRFLNYHHVNRFRERLEARPEWKGAVWEANKDMRSGVWLANFNGLPHAFKFDRKFDEFQSLVHGMWFHVELHDGVLARGLDDEAGEFQLRASGKVDAASVLDAFGRLHAFAEGERPNKRTKKAITFFMVRKPIAKRDLEFKRLATLLRDFAGRFGRFQ